MNTQSLHINLYNRLYKLIELDHKVKLLGYFVETSDANGSRVTYRSTKKTVMARLQLSRRQYEDGIKWLCDQGLLHRADVVGKKNYPVYVLDRSLMELKYLQDQEESKERGECGCDFCMVLRRSGYKLSAC